MTNGYSPSLAKPRASALITLAVLLFTFCLKTFGVIAPFRLKTLDLLLRPLPFAKGSPEVVVVTVDQPDLDFCKNQSDYKSTLDNILKSYRNILEGAYSGKILASAQRFPDCACYPTIRGFF